MLELFTELFGAGRSYELLRFATALFGASVVQLIIDNSIDTNLYISGTGKCLSCS